MKRLYSTLFSIAILVSVALPFSTTFAQATTTTTPPVAGTKSATIDNSYTPPADVQTYLDDCSITPGAGNLFPGCLEQLVYYIPYTFGAWAMGIAAEAFDAAANLTLSSTLYTTGSNFLEKGWTVTRDFANIFFILILLFIALSLVLDIEIGHANPKKMLVSVIMIAVLINFSFFMTEVVIDLSNSLALVFYNQISVVNSKDKQPVNNSDITDQLQGNKYINASAVKPLSVSLVRAFTPQVFSSSSFYTKLSQVGSRGFFTNATGTVTADKADKVGCNSWWQTNKCASSVDAVVIIPIMIIVGFMFLVVAYSFAVALISLIGRLIGLWIAIVFAPLAFVSIIIPSARSIPGLGWDEWWHGLLTNAFAAPIYFFFLLLISLLTQISLIPSDQASLDKLSPGILLVLVLIQFAIVITMLLQGTKYVRKAAGAIGEMVFKGVTTASGMAVGLAGGAALGTAALVGQGTLGFVGKKIAGADRMNRWAMGEGSGGFVSKALKQFAGEKIVKSGQFLGKSSFDARHTGAANALSSATGINLGSFGALSTTKTAGGLDAVINRKAERDEKFANSLKYNQKMDHDIKHAKEQKEDLIARQQVEFDTKEGLLKDAKDAAAIAMTPYETALAAAKTRLEAAIGMAVNPTNTVEVTAKNAAIAAAQAGVVAAQGNIATQKTANNTSISTAEADYKAEKAKLANLQNGEKDPATGKQRDVQVGDHLIDGTAVTAGNIADIIAKKMKTVETLSMKDFDDLAESNKKAAAKTYLAYQAQMSGYHTDVFRDKLGNVKGFHVDTTKMGDKKFMIGRMVKTALTTTAAGVLTGPILGLTTSMQSLGIGLSGVVRELSAGVASFATTGQFVAGSRYSSAEAAHHTAEPGGKHEHEHGVYHTPNNGFLAQLKSIFNSGGGGGGGGSHGGGHGGGGHH